MSIFYTIIDSVFLGDNSTRTSPTSRRSIQWAQNSHKLSIQSPLNYKTATNQKPEFMRSIFESEMVRLWRITPRNGNARPSTLPVDYQRNPNWIAGSPKEISTLQPALHAHKQIYVIGCLKSCNRYLNKAYMVRFRGTNLKIGNMRPPLIHLPHKIDVFHIKMYSKLSLPSKN